MAGLRERGKARRRAEIVGAAAALWRERGVADVGLQEIAAAAEVAPQTIHNLIGTHEQLVFAVIDELLDRLDVALARVETAGGVERAVQAARLSASMFTADAALYRQLVVRVPNALFAGERQSRDSATIQINALRCAQREGDIREEISPEAAGRAIFHSYLGALYAWGAGAITNEGFVVAAEIAALTTLTACATPGTARRLQIWLQALMGRAIDAERTAA